MAQEQTQLDQETFSCLLCRNLLMDPVTIPCGHNYCMKCTERVLDEESEEEIHSCPQCGQTFTPRPALVKSTELVVVKEEMETGLQAAPADPCSAGAEDVACDFCTGRKAIKSCMQCLVSYCENHLQPHYAIPPLKKHKLVEPSKNLQENICSRHGEVRKMFCRTDQQSICYLCSLEEHKGHVTVSAAAERTERQRELEGNIQQRIQDTEKDLKLLQQEEEAIDRSADKAGEDSETIFNELMHLLEKRSSDVKQQIRTQRETEVSRVRQRQEELQQQVPELKRKEAELKRLSRTEDHNQFLGNYPSLSQLGEAANTISGNISPTYFQDVTAAVSEIRAKLVDVLNEKWKSIPWVVSNVDVLLNPKVKSRNELLSYSREITMDPSTAYRHLLISEGNRKATRVRHALHNSTNPDRFTDCDQVLSVESLTGRSYWEVERTADRVAVAVAYKSIRRDGYNKECLFGQNDKSWALICNRNHGFGFLHNNTTTPVSGPLSPRIGVYVDHSAGILDFYSISEKMTRLHRVQTKFTEPLYAGLQIDYGNTAEFCKFK